MVAKIFEQVTSSTPDALRNYLLTEDPAEPPPVPCTAIYSRTDGVILDQLYRTGSPEYGQH